MTGPWLSAAPRQSPPGRGTAFVFTIADFTPPITMLVGLGVDYALLIFYRYRHELTDGADPAAAGRKALDAVGRTVFFAGCMVIIALLG